MATILIVDDDRNISKALKSKQTPQKFMSSASGLRLSIWATMIIRIFFSETAIMSYTKRHLMVMGAVSKQMEVLICWTFRVLQMPGTQYPAISAGIDAVILQSPKTTELTYVIWQLLLRLGWEEAGRKSVREFSETPFPVARFLWKLSGMAIAVTWWWTTLALESSTTGLNDVPMTWHFRIH